MNGKEYLMSQIRSYVSRGYGLPHYQLKNLVDMLDADEQQSSPVADGPQRVGESSVPQSAVDDREKLIRELSTEIRSVYDRKEEAEEEDDEGFDCVFLSGQLCGLIFARDLVKGFLCQETQSLVADDQARPAD